MKWLERCRIGGRLGYSTEPGSPVKYRYFRCHFTNPLEKQLVNAKTLALILEQILLYTCSGFDGLVVSRRLCHYGLLWVLDELDRRQVQVESLAGAVHLLKDNAGVLRLTQRGQKPLVEQKGKCQLDLDFQCDYRLRKRGLSILLVLQALIKRCQKSYHRDNWLVAAKRS